jgi:hypothetical protein
LAARRRWIFVTGVPRGGTTFVGRVLALAPQADYVNEPFNPDWGLAGVDRFYVTAHGQEAVQTEALVKQLLGLRGRMVGGPRGTQAGLSSWQRRRIASRNDLRYMKMCHDPRRRVVILKDPVGCLLTEYLAVEHRVQALG